MKKFDMKKGVIVDDPYTDDANQKGSISSVSKGFTTFISSDNPNPDSDTLTIEGLDAKYNTVHISNSTEILETILSTLECIQEQVNYLQATVDSIEAEIEDLKRDY